MKRILATSVFSVAMLAGGAGLALADGPGNSTPGLDRYLDNAGRQQATEVGAQCGSGAGSGAFGYFGKDNNLAGGANGQETGLNNSAICGNRQGNLE
ncbi:MAG: hypothetical protein KW802_02640 [Candidatus Doudnabacteria bacterium]|nr:hypothetical protein [Candidatus Doudnabacteria bacterium]